MPARLHQISRDGLLAQLFARLQTVQSFEQDRHNMFMANIADNTAHKAPLYAELLRFETD